MGRSWVGGAQVLPTVASGRDLRSWVEGVQPGPDLHQAACPLLGTDDRQRL